MTLPASGSLLFQVHGLAPHFSMVCRTPGRAHGCRMVHANAHEFRSLLLRQRLPLRRRCGLVLSVVLICWAPRARLHPCAVAKPKLQAADVATLVADFGRKYPSELLRPEVMPSVTFLGLVKEAVDNKQVSWVSWRLRTSEADEQALTERRKPRTDSPASALVAQSDQ